MKCLPNHIMKFHILPYLSSLEIFQLRAVNSNWHEISRSAWSKSLKISLSHHVSSLLGLIAQSDARNWIAQELRQSQIRFFKAVCQHNSATIHAPAISKPHHRIVQQQRGEGIPDYAHAIDDNATEYIFKKWVGSDSGQAAQGNRVLRHWSVIALERYITLQTQFLDLEQPPVISQEEAQFIKSNIISLISPMEVEMIGRYKYD